MAGILGILESSATQLYQNVTESQDYFFIITSIVYVTERGRMGEQEEGEQEEGEQEEGEQEEGEHERRRA
jgi:hypothetical protein